MSRRCCGHAVAHRAQARTGLQQQGGGGGVEQNTRFISSISTESFGSVRGHALDDAAGTHNVHAEDRQRLTVTRRPL